MIYCVCCFFPLPTKHDWIFNHGPGVRATKRTGEQSPVLRVTEYIHLIQNAIHGKDNLSETVFVPFFAPNSHTVVLHKMCNCLQFSVRYYRQYLEFSGVQNTNVNLFVNFGVMAEFITSYKMSGFSMEVADIYQ